MPSRPATPAPRAASCFATEAVRQGRPEPPPPPFQPHPSPRLRHIKGGFLQAHQAFRVQEFLMGGESTGLKLKFLHPESLMCLEEPAFDLAEARKSTPLKSRHP